MKTLYSAISRGTESLVFGGRIPVSEFERMRAPFMAGDFPFPVKYGYAAVGRVENGGGALRGKNVFALYPHQTAFNIPAGAVVALPEDVPPHRAVLAANMETALNGVWDAAPGPADRIAVVGAGVVGSLVAYLCGRIAGTDVTLVDINSGRAELAAHSGLISLSPETQSAIAISSFTPAARPMDYGTALELAGDEATVLEMSWYGDAAVTAMLGGPFHSRRLRLVSSQVGRIAPSHRPRWTHGRRLAAAIAPAQLIHGSTHCWRPGDCVRRFAGATAGNSRRRKRHTLPTHHLFVRSCLVHRRSSRPHHDRSFLSGRGFRARAGIAWRDLRGRCRLHRGDASTTMELSSTSAAHTMRSRRC